MSSGTRRWHGRTTAARAAAPRAPLPWLLNPGFWLLLLFALPLSAQTPPPEVEYADDFQSYQRNDNPPGWFDTPVGKPKPQADGLYKVRTDPTEGANASNLVYGTVQASGMPAGETPRIGTFSTLTTHTFDGTGRFEYTGRLVRTRKDSAIGITFFSSYPEVDSYYMIGLWSRAESNDLTMQWFSPDDRLLGGSIDSGVTLEPNTWYRFYIQADALPTVTRVRARFWVDGDPEPSQWQIDGFDDASSRLTSGRIGMWAAVRGESYLDDLWAKSPIDVTPPEITVTENDLSLANGAMFNRDATPAITVVDDIDPSPSWKATLDGDSFVSGSTVATEGFHRLEVEAFDAVLNRSAIAIDFVIDKTPPQVAFYEGDNALDDGVHLNRTIVPRLYVLDLTATTVTATLNGAIYEFGPVATGTNYREGSPVGDEGAWELHTLVTDAVGWQTESKVVFVVDKTPPAITLDSHEEAAVVATADIVLAGAADDAIVVTVNGSDAAIDPLTRHWSLPVSLVEGSNALSIRAEDRAGNVTTMQRSIILDTIAPTLKILSPSSGHCTNADVIEIVAEATDPNLESVSVSASSDEAVLDSVAAIRAADGSWATSLPIAAEGEWRIRVVAVDRAGHQRSASVSLGVDRTPPTIKIIENGQPFTSTLLSRSVTPQIRIDDADSKASFTATLDGEPWESGTQIIAEGDHALLVSAADCAGNGSESSITFTIDTTSPTITSTDPENGALLGSLPSTLTGSASEPVGSATLTSGDGVARKGVVSGTSFSFGAPGFGEGRNRMTLEVNDEAGNASQIALEVTIRTTEPAVDILDNGTPVSDGAVYRRPVTPEIRSTDPEATITATLNGSTFTSGTVITSDGTWNLSATATDTLGHTGSAAVSFSIDATPPVVSITSPAAGAKVEGSAVTVMGSAYEAANVSVNGTPATLSGTDWTASVALDLIDTVIVATALDAAGNRASASIEIERPRLPPAIVVTSPVDGTKTNRRETVIDGFVPSAGSVASVTVADHNGGEQSVAVDATGRFRVTGWPLTAGANTITVAATGDTGVTTSTSVTVEADFTAPSLTILADGVELRQDDRFDSAPALTTSVSDLEGTVTTTLRVDAGLVTEPFTTAADGWHTAIAVATDEAGNQSRIERRFQVGGPVPVAGCFIEGLDPIDGSAIAATSTRFGGRVGGAAGATVNGSPVTLEDGTFCTTVNLPAEGANTITVRCTDETGSATGDPAMITLHRVTGAPSITIGSPVNGSIFTAAGGEISVNGTADGATEVLVNGKVAAWDGSTFSANVLLTDGVNQISATARDALGNVAVDTTTIRYEKNLPKIVITSPSGTFRTGASTVQVSGTWRDLDPVTLKIGTIPASVRWFSDTHGAFVVNDVPASTGTSTLTVTGEDRTGRAASAQAAIERTDTRPWIVIDSPLDQTALGASATSIFVRGRAAGAPSSNIDVNGTLAAIASTGVAPAGSTQSTTYEFEATVPLSDLSTLTPVVARITQPDGAGASFVISLQRFSDAPAVASVYPEPGATSVDTSVLPLLLFGHAMDRDSIRSAFSLTSSAGTVLSGVVDLDGEVLSFAPAAPLQRGETYTITLGTAATDIAGVPLGQQFSSTFTTVGTAPSSAPTIDPVGVTCASSLTLTGTAPAGSRVRIDQGTLQLNATTSSAGVWKVELALDGRDGYRLLRARVVGIDGSLSPAAEACIRISCDRFQVVSSSFDRETNVLTIDFSSSLDPASATSSTITLTRATGETVSTSIAVSGSRVTVTPSLDLTADSFTLDVTTGLLRDDGEPLDAPYTRTFSGSGDEPVAGDGEGLLSGAVRTGEEGRPLSPASVEVSEPVGAYSTTPAEDHQ
ncbi:MAG: Ig-like domain-containing protein [Acidobacteria bacterium]|nr:Ig-like domain-containing protein [Acidobacteriota bacterium]